MCLQFVAESFQSRNRETHSRHCEHLSGPLHNHVATTYGVTRNSILKSSKYFHVTEGLLPDIMHDVLEGCAPFEMKELLKYLDSNNIVTFEEVNNEIEYCSPDIQNKPTVIQPSTFNSSDHSLKQKG